MRKTSALLAVLLALAIIPLTVVGQPRVPDNATKEGSDEKPAIVRTDTTKATKTYSNFVRVTGTPEEVIVDCGLNETPYGTPAQAIAIDQRIVMNFYTAKRMAAALQVTIDRHEAAFGKIETDVQKRVVKPNKAE